MAVWFVGPEWVCCLSMVDAGGVALSRGERFWGVDRRGAEWPVRDRRYARFPLRIRPVEGEGIRRLARVP